MMNEKSHAHSISGFVVFLLLGLFALAGCMLVLFGAQAYRATVDRTSAHSNARVLETYVRNAVRANDSEGALQVKTLEGRSVLCFTEKDEGETFTTYVYYDDGHLMELTAGDEYGFHPESGEILCDAADFQVEQEGQLLRVNMTDPDGTPCQVTIAVRGMTE